MRLLSLKSAAFNSGFWSSVSKIIAFRSFHSACVSPARDYWSEQPWTSQLSIFHEILSPQSGNLLFFFFSKFVLLQDRQKHILYGGAITMTAIDEAVCANLVRGKIEASRIFIKSQHTIQSLMLATFILRIWPIHKHYEIVIMNKNIRQIESKPRVFFYYHWTVWLGSGKNNTDNNNNKKTGSKRLHFLIVFLLLLFNDPLYLVWWHTHKFVTLLVR